MFKFKWDKFVPKTNYLLKKNIFHVLRNIFSLGVITGISTLKINIKNRHLVFTKFAAGFCAFLIIVNIAFLWMLPKVVFTAEGIPWRKNKTMKNVYKIVTSHHLIHKLIFPIAISFASTISRLFTLFSNKKVISKSFNLLYEVDIVLFPISSLVHDNSRKLKLMIFVILLLPILLQLYPILQTSRRSIGVSMAFLLMLFNNFSTSLIEVQFIHFCYFIQSRFNIINNMLKRIEYSNNGKYLLQGNANIALNNISYKIERICMSYQDGKIPGSFGNPSSSSTISQDVLSLKLSYRKISKALGCINEYYNVHLLISIALFVFIVLVSVYYSVYTAYNFPKHPVSYMGMYNDVVWTILILGRFYALCVAADIAASELFIWFLKGRRTKGLISDVINRDLPIATKYDLLNFFKYTTVREENVSVCGMFTLDLNLIATATASGATYLLILIQFNDE